MTIAHHRAIDELPSRRGKQARRELPNDRLGLLGSSDPNIDDALVRNEVQEALWVLPSDQREVIELIFWGGLTRREAADQLQAPLDTIHTRLRLGMKKLRAQFARFFALE